MWCPADQLLLGSSLHLKEGTKNVPYKINLSLIEEKNDLDLDSVQCFLILQGWKVWEVWGTVLRIRTNLCLYSGAIIWTLALMFIRLVVESELEANLAFMRGSLLTNETVSHSVHSGEMWFDNMTLYINLLQDIHDRLGTEIIQVLNAPLTSSLSVSLSL